MILALTQRARLSEEGDGYMEKAPASEESTVVDVTKLSLDEVRLLDDSVLAHSLRRFRQESEDERDPIVAFGAFNQHSSSPW